MKKTNFWNKLNKPFFVLAPMANVTDAATRRMLAKYGKPDVTWTEFVSADGLAHGIANENDPTAKKDGSLERLIIDLEYSRKERPIVAQLFTSNPESMRVAAKLIEKLGFDGLDINMGCPDRAVEKQGAGAALMKKPALALEVFEAARESVKIPVSIKTRIGFNKEEIDTWIRSLLEAKPVVLTVHLRTRKEMSDVPAHWELMPRIVALRDEVQADLPQTERTLIIGNGDVASLDEARAKTIETGCDGIMIGRGIFGKPWFFDQTKNMGVSARTDDQSSSIKRRLNIMLEHAILFDKLFRDCKNFAIMKKHFKAYVSGWDGAKELRIKLMEAQNIKEVKHIVKEYLALL